MKIKAKVVQYILRIFTATLVWFQSFAIPVELAIALDESNSEATQSIEQSPQPTNSEPSPSQPSNNPLSTEASINTGDATTTAETEITQLNQAQAPGNVPADCSIEGECSEDTSVSLDNQTTADTKTEADSSTGTNSQATNRTDSQTITGDATAIATTENQINTNQVELDPKISTPSAEPTATQSALPEEIETHVNIDNNAIIDALTDAVAGSGNNDQQSRSGDQAITTGDAIAVANSVNLINTNTIGSDTYFMVVDIFGGEQEVNLYQIWDQIIQGNVSFDEAGNLMVGDLAVFRLFELVAENQASVSAQASAAATTGDNLQQSVGGDQAIVTGNAYAVANSVSWLNTTISGSQILAGIINIFGNYSGDIIVPTAEHIDQLGLQYLEESYQAGIAIQNQSDLQNSANAFASTGQNIQESQRGDQSIQTGQAVAQANALAFIDTTIIANFFYELILNNFGNWTGSILGLASPTDQAAGISGTAFISQMPDQIGDAQDLPSITGQQNITITNLASLTNTAIASASTGNNYQQSIRGDQTITTGNAYAIANAIAFVNTTIIGSHGFLAVINVLGEWLGDLIFAHPDLAITNSSPQSQVSPGEEVVYTVTVTNQGHADAHGVAVHNDFPQALIHLSDSIPPTASDGSNRTWQLGNLPAGESVSFQVHTKVDPNLNPDTSEITYSLSVTGDMTEDISNNQASETDRVVYVNRSIGGPSQESNNSSQTDPNLSVYSSTNVGEYIHPGDSVILYLSAKNDSSGEAKEGLVTAMLYDPQGDPVSGIQWEAGTIKPHEVINLTFVVPIDKQSNPGSYYFASWVEAKDAQGSTHRSNQSFTEFSVVTKSVGNAQPAVGPQAPIIPQVEASNGQVLGRTTNYVDRTQRNLLYILAAALSALITLKYMKHKNFWLEAS